MNFSLYLFGQDQRGTYSQYPDDYTSSRLSALCVEVTTSKGWIIRDHDLVHYIYAENLGNSCVLGICLIFNKAYVKRVGKFFDFLRNIVENTLLNQGKIIAHNEHGDIEFVGPRICEDTRSYSYVKELINAALESDNNRYRVTHLITSYNGLHNQKTVDGTAFDSEIQRIQHEFNKIIIDFQRSINENKTQKTILALQESIADLNGTIETQRKEIDELIRTKKQYRNIIFLFVVLLGCCVGLGFLYNNLTRTEQILSDTKQKLSVATDSIKALRLEIFDINKTISVLNNEKSRLNEQLSEEQRLKADAQSKLNSITSGKSFIATDATCSHGSRWYKVSYYATDSGSQSFTLKIFKESTGEVYVTKSFTEYIYEGAHSFTVQYNGYFDTSRWYKFEVWSGNRLIIGGRY